MARLNCAMVLLLAFCFSSSLLLIVQGEHADSPCGTDWEPYKNEKCYKVLPNVGTFASAANACANASQSASLISIKFVEEQQFIANFLFNKSKVVDNVWLNARFYSGRLKLEQDGLDAQFTDWAAGRPRATANDRCVQLDPESNGKWIDQPCTRTGAVVCQKCQTWSIDKLQQTLLDTIKRLEMNQNELKDTQKRLTSTESQLKAAQTETKTRVEKLEKNPVPLGFLYFQLGGQPEPATLWPATKWNEVSWNYAGQFFRVVGGGAAQFGEVQGENAPRLVGVKESEGADMYHRLQKVSLSANNEWSNWVFTGAWTGKNIYAHSFKVSSGEVRPRNQAMRLWKRTG